MDKKVCVHNTSKNIFRLHPIPYISCVFDSATSECHAVQVALLSFRKDILGEMLVKILWSDFQKVTNE